MALVALILMHASVVCDLAMRMMYDPARSFRHITTSSSCHSGVFVSVSLVQTRCTMARWLPVMHMTRPRTN
ncbi:uncharacterized protein EI90DRAFT_3073670 [Cantharellus anzutake]|uniref:uncharacterized protein n=1 Tax=Cantharellus anzutake TaxID=1750568 RepID=UPI00190830B8|nr:uncharacterized protein EI90DRAFT_3073670 [Cantharellus anzutake]KAF8325271.1 hypothetical protein EI90DRAFT_3073670 [Cantharellus anzutake]